MAQKKYGGFIPEMIQGPDIAAPAIPDLSSINGAVVQRVKTRRQQIADPGYVMKVRDSCPYPCCQKLHQQAQQKQYHEVIIKKVIFKRRLIQTPEQLQAMAEAQERQRQEEEARRQQQEAQQRHQEELYRQQQEEAERQRQLQAAAEAEAERQRQAAAAAAAAPPAAPQQKVATFQNLGTDPAMAKAELYYESTRWGPLGHGDPPVAVGTFPGHRWFIVANGCYAKLFTVGEEPQQTFTF